MTPAEALELARRLAFQQRIQVTKHGRIRQGQRSVASAFDIRDALLSAKRATYDRDRDTWLFEGGADLDDEPLNIVLAFEDGEARLVTVIRP